MLVFDSRFLARYHSFSMLTPETVWFQDELQVRTEGRGTCDIRRDVRALVGRSEVRTGLCHIFIRHTSASLMLCENAAVEVRGTLKASCRGLRQMEIQAIDITMRDPMTWRHTSALC